MKSNRAVKWTAWAVVGAGLAWIGTVAGGCVGFGELALGECGDPCKEKTGAGGAGGTAGSGGTGGVGGTTTTGPVCEKPEDCPFTDENPCTTPVCGSDGMCSEPVDNTVVPPGGTQCEVFSCKDGATHTDFPDDKTACGPDPKKDKTHCDGMGSCIGCIDKGMCGTDDPCRTWECKDKKCTHTDTPAGVIPDAPSNCTRTRCDGLGGLVTEADPTDWLDDGKECTDDACNGMMPVSTNKQAKTPCGDPSMCQDAIVVIPQDECDGNGTCVQSTSVGCAPYACDLGGTGACKTNCTVANQEDDCVDANCVGGFCVAKLGGGAACQSNPDCLSGFCADGVCCNSACDTSCNSCNLGGATAGVCTPLPKGVPDNCVGGKACSGGTCANLNGKAAVGSGPCVTGIDCFNGDGNPATLECVNGLCRLLVGQACDLDKPHYCATNLCDATAHTCQECLANNDCPNMGCDIPNKRCQLAAGGVCGAAADCSPGHACTNNVCQ